MIKARTFLLGILFSLFALFLPACGSSDDAATTEEESETSYTYEFNQDSGGVSIVTVSASSFSVVDKDGTGATTGSSSGTVTRLDSGLGVVTTTASTNSLDIGTKMFATEVPDGFLFAVDAFEADGATSKMDGVQQAYLEVDVGIATGGSCSGVADGDTYNALATVDEITFDESTPAWATAAVSPGSSGLMLTLTTRLLSEDATASTPGTTVVDDLFCSGNTLSNAAGDEIIVTPSGLAILNFNGGGGYILAPVPTGLAEADVEAAGRHYAGLTMRPFDGNFDNSIPADGTVDGMAANMIGVYGNANPQSGPWDGINFTPISSLTGRGYDSANSVVGGWYDSTTTILIDGAASVSAPDGLFDTTFLDPLNANSRARFIVHEMPDGKLVLMGMTDPDNATAGPPYDWEYIFLMQNGDAVTVPDFSGVSGSDSYGINESDDVGNIEDIMLEIDYTTKNEWWATSDNGQLMWGTVTQMANGFLNFTQTGATSPDDNADLPFSFAGFEIPGNLIQLFFTDPDTGDSKSTTGFILDGCPVIGGDTGYNLMTMPDQDNVTLDTSAGSDDEFYGEATLNETSGDYTLTPGTNWVLLSNDADVTEPGALGTGACVGGATITGGGWGTSEMNTFPNGLAFMEDPSSPGSDSIIMMPQAAITPITSSVEYRGWAEEARYDSTEGTWQSSVTPIYARSSGTAGRLDAGPYTNVLTNSEASEEGGVIELDIAELTTGMSGAGLFDPDGTADPFRYMVMEDSTNGSRQVIIGILYDATVVPATDQNSQWLTIFLMEQ